MALVRYQRNEKEIKDAKYGGNGNRYAITPKEGKTVVRIMPPWSEKGVWFHRVREHFIDGRNISLPCTVDAAERCPVCEYGQELRESGNEAGAQAFRPSTKYLLNVIFLSEPTGKFSPKDGVKVFKVGRTVLDLIFGFDQDVAGGYGNVVDYENGFNFTIERTGKGFQTEYTVRPNREPTDIIKQLAEQGIDAEQFQLVALDAFVPEMSYEEASTQFKQIMSEPVEEQEQPVPVAEPTPVRRGPRLPGEEAPVVAAAPTAPAGFRMAAPKVSPIAPPPLPTKGN